MPPARRLRALFALPARDRRLLVRATITLGAVRLVLRLCAWPRAGRLFVRWTAPDPTAPPRADAPVDRLRWAVLTAAHELPGATCLAQALALQILLARTGRSSALRLGVTGGTAAAFAAHAWLEYDGDRADRGARFALRSLARR